MARGSIAKTTISERIRQALADCFVAEVDKKLYFEAQDDGEVVQVCVAFTCPKTGVSPDGTNPKPASVVPEMQKKPFDWSGTPQSMQAINNSDSATIDELMARLGIQ